MVNGKPPEPEDKAMSEQEPREHDYDACSNVLFVRRVLIEMAAAYDNPFYEQLADVLLDVFEEISGPGGTAEISGDGEAGPDEELLGSGPPHSEAEH